MVAAAARQVYYYPPDPDRAEAWIRGMHGTTLWGDDKTGQTAIVRAVFGGPHRFTVVRSGNAVGKTTTAANVGMAWLGTGADRMLITTAPTGRQVKDLLWKEMRKVVQAIRLRHGLVVLMPPRAPEIRMHADRPDWFGVGFASRDPVNFLGRHSPGGVLIILDEAPGVPPALWDSLKSSLTGEWDRILAIGNPMEPSGPFYDAFRQGPWNRLHISAFDSPNVKARKTVIQGLVSHTWIDDMRLEWGEGSPMWLSRVEGQFTDGGANVLIPLAWLEAANERWRELEHWSAKPARERDEDDPVWKDASETFGVDLAQGGANDTVIARGHPQGVRSFIKPPRKFTGIDVTGETTGWVLSEVDRHPKVDEIRGDGDGGGRGVTDALAAHYRDNRKRRVNVIPMRGGLAPLTPDMFLNRRCEMLWNLRQLCDPSRKGGPIALPPDPKLQKQATSIRWSYTSRKLIRLETKDEMRARGMPSPDELDAAAFAMAMVEAPRAPPPSFIPLNLSLRPSHKD